MLGPGSPVCAHLHPSAAPLSCLLAAQCFITSQPLPPQQEGLTLARGAHSHPRPPTRTQILAELTTRATFLPLMSLTIFILSRKEKSGNDPPWTLPHYLVFLWLWQLPERAPTHFSFLLPGAWHTIPQPILRSALTRETFSLFL